MVLVIVTICGSWRKNIKILRSEQETSGDPTYPSGQVQIALCLVTLQLAAGAQTLGLAQGLMHFLASHAV